MKPVPPGRRPTCNCSHFGCYSAGPQLTITHFTNTYWHGTLLYNYTGMPSVDGTGASASRTRPCGFHIPTPRGDVQTNGATICIHGRHMGDRNSVAARGLVRLYDDGPHQQRCWGLASAPEPSWQARYYSKPLFNLCKSMLTGTFDI